MMEYKGYIGRVEFDADANMLHGEVLGIRDVVTFQADSVPELQKAFRESVDDYLAFCKSRGETPDKPLSGKFVVRINPDLHRRLSLAAARTKKSLNAFVAEQLQHGLSHIDEPTLRKPKLSQRQRRGGSSRSRGHAA